MTEHKGIHWIASQADLARALELGPEASRSEIEVAFMMRSRFDAEVEILDRVEEIEFPEVWEIVVRRARPRCLVRVRRGCRGPWTSEAGGIPEDVLAAFALSIDRFGSLTTDRPWSAWRSMGWTRSVAARRVRRLRARCDEIRAVVEIAAVRREMSRRLSLDVVATPPGREERDLRVSFSLPCHVPDIWAAVDGFRKPPRERVLALTEDQREVAGPSAQRGSAP